MTTDPTPRRCDGCGRDLAVYTVPPGQAPRGVTYVCLDCADRSKPSVSVAPPPTVLTPDLRRWDWTGAKVPPSAEEQAAAVRAMMAIPFDELGYLRARLAETTEIARRLEAERDNLPRLWWVRDDAEEGACCYDAPTAAEAVAKALPDFGYEPDDDADLTVLPVTELHVSGLQDEVRTLRARVAELDEAARWRMLPERPKVGVRVDVALSPAGWRCSGAYAGGDLWVVSGQLVCTDADILGWRPLGPGPEVAGG